LDEEEKNEFHYKLDTFDANLAFRQELKDREKENTLDSVYDSRPMCSV